MKLLKKVLLFPVKLVLMFINMLLDLFMRVEVGCRNRWAVLLACLIYSLINRITFMWGYFQALLLLVGVCIAHCRD